MNGDIIKSNAKSSQKVAFNRNASLSNTGEVSCARACRLWPKSGVKYGWFVLLNNKVL